MTNVDGGYDMVEVVGENKPLVVIEIIFEVGFILTLSTTTVTPD